MKAYAVPEAQNLTPGEKCKVRVGGKEITIYNVNGTLYALGGICPHQSGPLCNGNTFDNFQARVTEDRDFEEYIESRGSVVACPWHGWEYDIATGVCLWNPKYRVATYEVRRTDNGEVEVLV